MSENWSDFVEESTERITRLNNELLTLERDPDDEKAMRTIFRIAHTLKGNAGAAGFEPASDLAHAIEDLLDAIRSGRLEVTPERMDVVFDAVDEFETMLKEIDATGEIRTDPSATIRTIRDTLEAEATVSSVEPPSSAAIDSVLARLESPTDGDHNAYFVRFAVTEDDAGETTNGTLVLEALVDAFDLVGTDPAPGRIEAGEYDGRLDAVFGSAVGETAIGAALEPIDAIADFEIVEVTDRIDDSHSRDDESTVDSAGDLAAGISQGDAQDLEVDDLLEEFDEFDDLEEKVKEVENDDDLEVFDEMGEAGSFDELFEEAEVVDPELEPGGPPTDHADEVTDDEPAAGDADDEVDDAGAVFEELKAEVDPVGFEELQDELADLEFDEFDEEEVGMDDLLGDDLDDDSIDETDADIDGDTAPEQAADESEPESDAGLDEGSTGRGETSGPDETTTETPTTEPADTATASAPGSEPSDTLEPSNTAADTEVAADLETETDTDTTDDTKTADEVDGPDDAKTVDEVDGPDGSDEPTVADDAASPADGTVTTADDGGASVAEPSDEATDDATVPGTDPADGSAGADFDTASVEAAETDFVEESFETTAPDFEDESLDAAASDFDDEPFGSTDVDTDDEPFGSADVDTDDEPFERADTDFDNESFDTSHDGFDDASLGSSPTVESDDWTVRDDEASATDSVESDDGSIETTGSATPVENSSEPTASDEDDHAADSTPAEETLEDASADLLDLEDGSDDSFEETFGADALEDGSLEDDDWFDDGADTTETDGEDGADAGFDEEIVTTIEEPALEIPDITVPDSIDRDDREAVSNETTSVRVDVEQIDDLLTLVEGLVTSRVRLRHAVETDLDRDAIETELDDLEALLGELQGTVMDVRLVPLETVTNRLPRIVRDVAREQDKEVSFEMTGSDVEIDRTILDRLRDPLTHLVRNAVDHGIEPPDRREQARKPREGRIEITATRSRDQVTITVTDDGRGLDPDELTAEAVEAGVITEDEAASMDDDDAFELVFHPGLSTADEVTDVSGRGVGMDVVERTVTELDGTISIDSETDGGTTVTMTLPVSIAIDDVLFVECGGEEFGVPTTAVHDIEPVEAAETVDGDHVLPVDDEQYPVLSLEEELETPASEANGDGMLVRIREDVRPVALECDHVRGQQEVVVKPFDGFMRDIPGLSGATVRGRGEVVNILDVTTL